jgi:drug/metabolite transporter (DMT)-like permease
VHALPTSWSTTWPLLLLLLCGATSIVCAQSAYQAGALIESLPSLTVLEPVVAVVVASMAYGERLHPGPWWHVGQVAGMVLLAAGVTGIARAEGRRHTPLSEGVPDAPAGAGMPPSAGSRSL